MDKGIVLERISKNLAHVCRTNSGGIVRVCPLGADERQCPFTWDLEHCRNGSRAAWKKFLTGEKRCADFKKTRDALAPILADWCRSRPKDSSDPEICIWGGKDYYFCPACSEKNGCHGVTPEVWERILKRLG